MNKVVHLPGPTAKQVRAINHIARVVNPIVEMANFLVVCLERSLLNLHAKCYIMSFNISACRISRTESSIYPTQFQNNSTLVVVSYITTKQFIHKKLDFPPRNPTIAYPLVNNHVVKDVGANTNDHTPFESVGKPTDAKSSDALVLYTREAFRLSAVFWKDTGMVSVLVYALIAMRAKVVEDSTARILVVVSFTMCLTYPAARCGCEFLRKVIGETTLGPLTFDEIAKML